MIHDYNNIVMNITKRYNAKVSKEVLSMIHCVLLTILTIMIVVNFN